MQLVLYVSLCAVIVGALISINFIRGGTLFEVTVMAVSYTIFLAVFVLPSLVLRPLTASPGSGKPGKYMQLVEMESSYHVIEKLLLSTLLFSCLLEVYREHTRQRQVAKPEAFRQPDVHFVLQPDGTIDLLRRLPAVHDERLAPTCTCV